jgi:uncharacterized membrane protein YphA (DoxX/SURF4 family)
MVVNILRVSLGAMLIVAVAGKVWNYRRFFQVISAITHTSAQFAPGLGCSVMLVEVVLGALLLAGYQTTFAALASSALFLTFAGVLAVNLWLGSTNTSCGCFGSTGQISRGVVLRNVLLTFASFAVAKDVLSASALVSVSVPAALITGMVMILATHDATSASASVTTAASD